MAFPWGAILGAGASLFAGDQAGKAQRRAQRDADRYQRDILNQLKDIDIPEVRELMLQVPELVGEYTPEEIQEILLQGTALEDIQVDPRYKDAQLKALSQLEEMGEVGLTDIEKAQMNAMRRDVAQQAKARDASILQEMAARGVAGSGAELAQRIASSQAAANRGAEEGDRLAAMMQQRALESIAQAGSLGGNIRQQEFSEQERIKSAIDRINEFNTQNKINTQASNVGERNRAALTNLGAKQRIADLRAEARNREQLNRQEQEQARFRNESSVITGQMAPSTNLGNLAIAGGNRAADSFTEMGRGAGQLAKELIDYDWGKKSTPSTNYSMDNLRSAQDDYWSQKGK